MSSKEIPATKVWSCDSCSREYHSKYRPTKWAEVYINRDAHDASGAAVAANNMAFDFCETCTAVVIRAINGSIDKVRERNGL